MNLKCWIILVEKDVCIGPSAGCLSGTKILGRSVKDLSQSASSLTSLRKWMSWASSDPVLGGQLASPLE